MTLISMRLIMNMKKGESFCEPLELDEITLNMKIPIKVEMFWASESN